MANGFLQTLGQGLGAVLSNTPLSQVQDAARQRRQQSQVQSLQQQLGQSGNINSPEFQQLAALNPTLAGQVASSFNDLDDRRKQALFTDARGIRLDLESNNVDRAMGTINARLDALQQLPSADPNDTIEISNLITSGNIPGAIDLLKQTETIGMQTNDSKGNVFLSDPRVRDAKLEKASGVKDKKVQNSRDVKGGTLITFNDGSQQFKAFGDDLLTAGQEAAQRDLPKLTSSLQNKQLELQESANSAFSLADKTTSLANKFSKLDTPAGVAGSVRESFLNVVGGQDAISNLRKDFTRIRNKLITENLPQGPATDKDIELIAAGFPAATASKAQIVDFLNAMSRGQEAVAKFDEFKSSFLQENGNLTRATRDFEFDGQPVKKGERLQSAYKRISKNLQTNIGKDEPDQQTETQPAQAAAVTGQVLNFDAQGNPIQ